MSSVPISYATSGDTSFWRTYQVTIDNNDGSGAQWGNLTAGSSNLRMAFSVTRKGAGGDPSAGGMAPGPRSIVLSNLSPQSRAVIQRGTRITLQAGYGNNVATMFNGSVKTATTERAGADINTSIEMLDEELFTDGCVFNATYAPGENFTGGVRLTQVLRDIAAAMRLTYYKNTVSVQNGVFVGVVDRYYPVGLYFNGTCRDALNDLLAPQGLVYNVYNGELNIFPQNGYDAQPAVYLSPDSGLINTPSFLQGKLGVGQPTRIQVQSLLNPLLQPGRLVTFSTPSQPGATEALRALPGYFRIMNVTHKGDTHGQAWDSSCEAEVFAGDVTALAAKPL